MPWISTMILIQQSSSIGGACSHSLLLAELFEKSGFDLLDAYIVGLEIMGLIGQGLNPFHRKREVVCNDYDWNDSSNGCRIRLLGLDRIRRKMHFNFHQFSGGSMAQFGSEMKPLHAGMASSFAIQSAILAKSGIVGGDDTLRAHMESCH